MRYRIQRNADGTWSLVRVAVDAVRASAGAGFAAEVSTVVATFSNGTMADGETPVPDDEAFLHHPQHAYSLACQALGGILTETRRIAAAAGEPDPMLGPNGDGLLPETWTSDAGICFSRALPGGRDFSECVWSWRDPAVSMVPLMFQSCTEYGHFGAELAGFVESFRGTTTPGASGRFFANDEGTELRAMMLGAGRIGVSVDPSELVDVEESFECLEFDDDGWCDAGKWTINFLAYEIAGITATPFPAFEDASIIISGSVSASAHVTEPARAAATIPTDPPREWMTLAEATIGQAFLDGYGEDFLVEQVDPTTGEVLGLAVPFTITDAGQVYGHLTYWGQCHTGNPWGANRCASVSPSQTNYAEFMTGETTCADGSRVASGALSVGCEHSWAMDCAGARDHLAQAGLAFARVRASNGEHGVWVAGALAPTLTEAQVATLRGLTLSGEWIGELAGVLAVNQGGLPIQRRIAASMGAGTIPIAASRTRRKGDTVKTIGANLVRNCPECAKRAAGQRGPTAGIEREMRTMLRKMDQALDTLAVLRARTGHLVEREAEHLRAQVR